MSTIFRTQKIPLIYSNEFRELVLKAYPDSPAITDLLDNNQYFLGRYLDDGSSGCVSSIELETIIEKIESDNINELLELAKKKIEEVKLNRLKIEVYSMWGKEVYMD